MLGLSRDVLSIDIFTLSLIPLELNVILIFLIYILCAVRVCFVVRRAEGDECMELICPIAT
jgi:hypothetical protein